MGVCVWLKFKKTGEGAKALLDTGAGISLIPKNLYDVIAEAQETQLRRPDRRITGANSKSIECFGVATLAFSVDDHNFKHDFYVCEDDVTVLLGRKIHERC
jgi:hypothetical protein